MALFHTTVVDNQIKALSTIGSASGSIATFDTDKADRLVNLEVAITATGGGGTPVSPIAINGFSQAVVNACGKNLFDKDSALIQYFIKSNGQPEPSADWSASNYIKVKSNTNYILSGVVNTGSLAKHAFYDINKNLISVVNCTEYQLTTPNNCAWVRLSLKTETPNTVQLEQGNIATTYVAYNGTTETITFGQTVYGGRLNVGSGVLTITHGYVEFDGSADENWDIQTSGSNKRFVGYDNNISVNENSTNHIANMFSIASGNNAGGCYIYNDVFAIYASKQVYLSGNVANSVPDLTTMLSNTPLQIAYELATPITIQLDSKQLQSIIGTNNIYADTGDIIDLKFVLSVGKAIS